VADRQLIAASAVDRAYGLRHGTAACAARAGLVRAVERPGRGRYRRVLLISATDAEIRWGARRLELVDA
jgi:hypothetical protein